MTKELLQKIYPRSLEVAKQLFGKNPKNKTKTECCKLIYAEILKGAEYFYKQNGSKNLCFRGDDAAAEKSFAYKLVNEVLGIPASNHGATAWRAMQEFLKELGVKTASPKKPKRTAVKPQAQPQPTPKQTPEVKSQPKGEEEEIVHERFSDMLNIIRNRHAHGQSLYLYGPAGTGKSHIAEQLANHFGLKYRVMNSCRDVYDLKGFRNAAGEFMETDFYDCFVNGGVFCLDEIDNSDAQSLTCINGALANKQLMFGDGKLHKQHKDFVFIACANTVGRGGNNDYIRDVLDKSTLDRFCFIETNYDQRIELLLAKGAQYPKELVEFVDELRESAKKCGIELLITYRAVKTIAALESAMGIEKAVNYGINRGLSKEDLHQLAANCNCGLNHYLRALNSIY